MVILISKKGKRLSNIEAKAEKCAECEIAYPKCGSLTRYSKSNLGQVCVCGACLTKVQERSWDEIDAFDVRGRIGGAFTK